MFDRYRPTFFSIVCLLGCLTTAAASFGAPSKAKGRRTYARSLQEQIEQLKTDEQMAQFAKSRRRLATDRYRPIYHYVNPEGKLSDPNGLCYWQGRYHLFYQAYPLEDPRQHWGHAVSDDLVHWKDLPLAIYPSIEDACYSGSTWVDKDRVIALYYGAGVGNMVAISSDPLLLNWEKIPGNPVIPVSVAGHNDPCIWKEKDGYYSLLGIRPARPMIQRLFFSKDLQNWKYLGPFVEGTGFLKRYEDGAVPYFWPIGDKHILIFASHRRGAQYLLGDYDKINRKFNPFAHGRFNFGTIYPGGVHAPSATPDGKGGVYVINNINAALPWGTLAWNEIMSLAQVLTLQEDNTLGIEPIPAVESLHDNHKHVGATSLPANQDIVLEGIEGNAMELAAEIDPQNAREVCIKVLRSPDSEEYTAVKFYRSREDALAIDSSRSSLRPDVLGRPPEVSPFTLPDGEPLKLRIFIDKSVVEVFANGRQCLALRVYPEREDSVGVSIRAQGSDAVLRRLDAWQMKSIYAESKN